MKTFCLPPIVAALLASEEFLGSGIKLITEPGPQQEFVDRYFELMRGHVAEMPEIQSLATYDRAELEGFLKKWGFTVALNPFPSGQFGAAAVLDLNLTWRLPGDRLIINGYPGFRLSEGGGDVCFWQGRLGGNLVDAAQVVTSSGDEVFLVPVEDLAQEGLDLFSEVMSLLKSLYPHPEGFDGLQVPMVRLEDAFDIDWLQGMGVWGDLGVAQVGVFKQITRLRMNEQGARVESAAASMMITCRVRERKPDFIIDKPFLAIFTRPEIPLPLAVVYATQKTWMEPGDISQPFEG